MLFGKKNAEKALTKEQSLENYLYASDKARMKELVRDMMEHSMGSMNMAVVALAALNQASAKRVIASDDWIDEMEERIDQECLYSIAMRQPTRGDLRFVYAVMKIITDIERIGDQSVNIATRLLRYLGDTQDAHAASERKPIPHLDDIQKMCSMCNEIGQDFMDAFESEDGGILDRTKTIRHEVNAIADSAVSDLIHSMSDGGRKPMELFHAIWIIRHLGRISDHMMNLAEKVYFIKTGISPLTQQKQAPGSQPEDLDSER